MLGVGRLVEKKGFDVAIAAVALLGDGVSLRIVGTGVDEGRLRREVADRGVWMRVVEFAGPRTHLELPHEYAGADVVVVPSVVDRQGDRDGLPNVVLEAMASGVAVVASDVAAVSDAVEHDVTGLLVPPGEPAALAVGAAPPAARPRAAPAPRRGRRGGAWSPATTSRRAPRPCARTWAGCMGEAANRPPLVPVAYVLKGFPRRSETFIASEIHRVEQLGVDVRLFVLKPADEPDRHPVVDRIRAVPVVPAGHHVAVGQRRHPVAGPQPPVRSCRPSVPSLAGVPLGLARATGMALAQAMRARRHLLAAPRKIYLKELLLAVALAQRVLDDPAIAHLHAHFAHGSTTVTWLASTITGLPFSFTGHAKDLYSDELNPAGLLARKAAAASFVVTCTEANGRHLRALGTSTPIHVIHHGLSSDFATLTAEPMERRRGPVLRILGVGRLVPKKGFDTFVEACAHLRRARGAVRSGHRRGARRPRARGPRRWSPPTGWSGT